MSERTLSAEISREETADASRSSTSEGPTEERTDYTLAVAKICLGPESGIYVIELFSGLRYSYDLRKYRELSEADAASKFMVRMFSSQIIDSMNISGVPTRRIFDRKAGDATR